MTERGSGTVLEPGTILLEYTIERVLGAGTFGIVYKAANRFLDEVVAIKEYFPSDLAYRSEDFQVVPKSPETESTFQWALKRFLKEARILWNLSRPVPAPSIIQVKSYRELNGTAYMIMEYAEGQSLQDVIRDRRTLSREQMELIVDPLLDGLEKVHNAAVLHRDIKPSNILIRPDGTPVLIDFGAAKPDIDQSNQRSTISVYTPKYAPPEQLTPDGRLGAWTDIYSLGATLYYAVTGEPPISPIARIQGGKSISAVEAASGRYPENLLKAIDAAIEPIYTVRPQSIAAIRKLIYPTTNEDPEATIVMPPPTATPVRRAAPGVANAAMASPAQATATGNGLFIKRRLFYGGIVLIAIVAVYGVQNYLKQRPAEPPKSVDTQAIRPSLEPLAEQVNRRLAEFDCALLERRITDNNFLEISGHIANPETLQKLEQSLSEVSAINKIHSEILPDLDPFCNVIRLYKQYQDVRTEKDRAVTLQFNHPDRVYRNKDILSITAISNTQSQGYLYVDFFDREGNVVHMLPTPLSPDNGLAYRDEIALGEKYKVADDENKRSYEILPPFGTHIVASVFSDSPLYDGLRPEVESADAYRNDLETILKAIPDETRPAISVAAVNTWESQFAPQQTGNRASE
jgi:predicted Ser/Thr protein kinase